MRYEFLIKLQNRKYGKGRLRVVIAMACFIIALVIMMLNSFYYAVVLAVPIFYLAIRFKNMVSEKYYISDAQCKMFFYKDNFTFEIQPYTKNYTGIYRVNYADLQGLEICGDGKVDFTMNQYELEDKLRIKTRTISFYLSQKDKESLLSEMQKHINMVCIK